MLATVNGVTKNYGGKEGVNNVSLSINAGEAVGLLGLNGAGKTTLLKLLAGLLFPTVGEIEVLGKTPRQARANIAYLSDQALYPWLTPVDAEKLMMGLFPDFRPKKYRDLLNFLEVPQKQNKSMSLGQKARLRLAMALGREAKLYLLDEPLGGMDLISRDKILRSLVANWAEDSAIVLSTHEVLEAEGIFDRAVFMREGRIVMDVSAEQLRSEGKGVVDTFKEVLA